ncbi:MAG: tRNA (guanosine(46)-N7)-methyltransferase TrmB [Bacteroidetes bacterium RIFCSPLOWO2_12_FULL_31_6]|nr:MAG: tRNA (guanosine(46)-N7)-methyltransferase TrmB [Bacteroidetes bacterium RIFCSPLOWO2_12_FULL_31_6]
MGKDKLKRYAEVREFSNVLRPGFEEVKKSLSIKGNWNAHYFNNRNPIIVELGCGGGEYTLGLALKYPDKNFIGIDIKDARIWKGARVALANNLKNVAFVRTRIEFIENVFAQNEIHEIWITFPDPQPKISKASQRLTSAEYIQRYKNILKTDGLINFKTDNVDLFNFSLGVISKNKHNLLLSTFDLYASLEEESNALKNESEVLSIPTFYEQKFRKLGIKICYLQFRL